MACVFLYQYLYCGNANTTSMDAAGKPIAMTSFLFQIRYISKHDTWSHCLTASVHTDDYIVSEGPRHLKSTAISLLDEVTQLLASLREPQIITSHAYCTLPFPLCSWLQGSSEELTVFMAIDLDVRVCGRCNVY